MSARRIGTRSYDVFDRVVGFRFFVLDHHQGTGILWS